MATAFIALKHFQAKMPGDGSARFELAWMFMEGTWSLLPSAFLEWNSDLRSMELSSLSFLRKWGFNGEDSPYIAEKRFWMFIDMGIFNGGRNIKTLPIHFVTRVEVAGPSLTYT